MQSSRESFLDSLAAFSKGQINQAGQRYTPGRDQSAPNIRIEALIAAIENVACGERARARFQLMLDAFSDAWKNAKYYSQRPDAIQEQVDKACDFLAPMMDQLRAGEASAGEEWSDILTRIESDLMSDMKHWRLEAGKLQSTERNTGDSDEYGNIRYKMNVIEHCLIILRDEKEYGQSAAFKVLHDPNLLVSGEWGTGKTHLLCDVTRDRIGHNQSTVLVLAKNFRGSVVTEICSLIKGDCTAREIFDQLEKLAYETKERAIFILDGVNEGNRQEWRKAVAALHSLVAARPNIGLIVSCRTPLESIAIRKEILDKFHKVVHRGFDAQGFDAQAEFFQYYNLPLPEVPLLNREFSRPLTLKLICRSLQNLTGKKLAQGFSGIASGQKGMTYVIESFVKRIGKTIECQYGLRPRGCWELLKGSDKINDRKSAGFAPCMAEKSRNYVSHAEADRIVAVNYPKLKKIQRLRLLDELRTSGLIDEDIVPYSTKLRNKSRIVFRLPYERFSDHLIARCLLSKKYLSVSSTKTIKKSFAGKSPLARVFRISNRHNREYEMPGWAQALITEFPIRAKKLPFEQRELFFMLPKQSKDLNVYIGPLIEGIFWRDPAAFTKGTRTIIDLCLKSRSQIWEQMIDALVAVSTKPKHPYHARRLYDFLANDSMPDRDLRWSEYLRQPYASLTIRRLLMWAENLDAAKMTQCSAEQIVVLLSLVLTTVVRKDRDLATKTLVLIGERFPKVLFAHVVTSLGFNDPYVPERMLAAAYGVTLSLVDSDAVPTFRSHLGNLAQILYQKMFGPRAENATHHTLMRDYALGIIEIAQRWNCISLPKITNHDLIAPFPNTLSTFTSDGTPNPFVDESIGHVIEMDFGNYTIGRLIPDRSNYDYENLDYIKIRAKIERRIFDLGYRAEYFKDIDDKIGNKSWRARDQDKVDRYGKKYSWIAYFEMWGEREAARKLPNSHHRERTSDCGIDPSFPKRPPSWTPPIPDLFGDEDDTTEDWVKGGYTPNWCSLLVIPEINEHQGKWVLLEGFVQRSVEHHDREIFAFLRGMFIARKYLCSFREKFFEVDYPGNHKIPLGASELYVYAGEVGRRQRYAQNLYRRNIGYSRQIGKAFDQHSKIYTKGKTPPVSNIPFEIPYINFGWESYHSSYNDFSDFNLPAPSLIQRLDLSSKNREIDFYDSMGKPGTLYRESGGEWSGDRHKLLYIRADLLQRYLKDTRQVLVWCNWGERDWFKKMKGRDVIRTPARKRIYNAYDNIHRSFFQWSAKNCNVIQSGRK